MRLLDRPLAICFIRSASLRRVLGRYFACFRFRKELLDYRRIVRCICSFSAKGRTSTLRVNSAMSWKDSLLRMRLAESFGGRLGLRWPELLPLLLAVTT